MSTGTLNPVIHEPERLRIAAALAALPDGDALSVTRLQRLLRLTPASLFTRLRELDLAGYIHTGPTGDDQAAVTVALTRDGRTALDRYAAALRRPAGELPAPAPGLRAADADRDAVAAALGAHYAQGRLTLEELNARLDATLTAATYGDLARAMRDLPDLARPPRRPSR
jgi:DNA-binding MarR family transcriptional regulator